MLILTRKKNEEIRIDSNIVIKIVSISDKHVKIGIDAPAEIEILRGELYATVKESTIEASLQSKQKVPAVSELKINKIRK